MVADGISVVARHPLPEMQAMVNHVVREASCEASPGGARAAVAAEVEAGQESDVGISPSGQHRNFQA